MVLLHPVLSRISTIWDRSNRSRAAASRRGGPDLDRLPADAERRELQFGGGEGTNPGGNKSTHRRITLSGKKGRAVHLFGSAAFILLDLNVRYGSGAAVRLLHWDVRYAHTSGY